MQYLGIAADEPERIERHTRPGIILPLVDIGWDEAYCRKWCEENDLLSPIYTNAARGGCWFCPMDELLGLIADINPTEIASHIEQGNLAEWCEGWRQVATVTVENLRLSESD